jgi:lipoate synthase
MLQQMDVISSQMKPSITKQVRETVPYLLRFVILNFYYSKTLDIFASTENPFPSMPTKVYLNLLLFFQAAQEMG